MQLKRNFCQAVKNVLTQIKVIFYGFVIAIAPFESQSAPIPPGDFTFNVVPETFQVDILHNGMQEQVSAPLPRMNIANLQKTASIVSWSVPGRGISVVVEKKTNYLDISIHSEQTQEFSWPRLQAGSYMLPLWEGKYILAKDSLWRSFLKGRILNFSENFSMGFFALNKPNYAIVYIAKNIFNNFVHFYARPDISFTFSHQFTSVNKEKTYGFRIYITDNTPVSVSTVYKNYIRESERFKTLEEKALSNPNIRKLYGAPHIYLWPHGLISVDDISWKIFLSSIRSNEKLFRWVVHLIKNYDEEDNASEFYRIWQDCSKTGRINDYQKKTIVLNLNKILSMKELYSPDVFNHSASSVQIEKLSEQKLYRLNKALLKSSLKDAITDPQEWGKKNMDLLDDMHRSGIKKAWIGLPDWADGLKNPLMVEKANRLGYLIGPYDSYLDIQQKEDRSWRTTWFPDSSLYQTASITDVAGKKFEGFLGRGRLLNPTLALPSVKQRVSAILSDSIPYNTWFLDCDAFGIAYDDYSPTHITTQEEDVKARLGRMDYISGNINMVVGSEGGCDYAASSLAFAQGLEMPVFDWSDPDLRKNKDSPYYLGGYWAPEGTIPPKYIKLVPAKPLYKHIYIDPCYSLPLFRLVYNDAVITTAHWESGSLRIKREIGNRMLAELLYNTPPLYHLDHNEWKHNKDRIINHLKTWTRLHEKTVTLPMTAFNILSDDRKIQQTIFGNSIKITVNFSDRDFTLNGQIIKARTAEIIDGPQRSIYAVGNF